MDLTTRTRGYLLEPHSDPAVPDDHLALINRLAQTPLAPDDVYIRSMYLCSNQLCESDWSRFSDRALDQIRDKVVGESVLAGHDKKSLPVARFFKAAVVDRPDVPDPETGLPTKWVRAWFYWLKATHGARDLALNMDGGIYREVSISWRFRAARCAVCNHSPRSCPHVPGEVYDGVGCYQWIDEIVDVLEGSLVYRGADRSTGIAGDRDAAPNDSRVTLARMLLFEHGPTPIEETSP